MIKPHVRPFAALASLVIAALALLGCGGSDDTVAEPTTAPVETPVVNTPEPAEDPTPTPFPTATPLPTISAPTVPTVANGTCDRIPFSEWNAANGDLVTFGTLDQFNIIRGGESSFGGYECEGDIATATLRDGTVIEAIYTSDPSTLTIDGVGFDYNEERSSFQE